MASQELVKYFKEGMKRGVSLIELKNNLLDSGWSEDEVQLAFNEYITGVRRRGPLKFDYKILIIVAVVFLLIGVVVLFTAMNSEADVLTKTDLMAGKSVELVRNPVMLELDGKTSQISLDSTYDDYAKVNINGIVVRINNTDKEIDLDFDGDMDIMIRLEKIRGNVPEIYLKLVEDEVKTVNDTIAELENFTLPESFNVSINGTCAQNWTCGDWTDCDSNKQNRTCVENSGCNETSSKPTTSRSCGEDEYGCYIFYEPCFEPEGFFCNEGGDKNEYDPYCCSGECIEFDLDSFCYEKKSTGTDYSYFENNATHVCSESKLFPFNDTFISCCEEGVVEEVDSNELLDGETVISDIEVTIFNETLSVDEYPIGNYSVSVTFSGLNVSWVDCYSKNDSLRYCESHVSSADGHVGGGGDLSGFYLDENGYSQLMFDGFNETGTYKYEYYVYLCRVVNNELGVTNCVVSESEIDVKLDGLEYDYGYGTVSVI